MNPPAPGSTKLVYDFEEPYASFSVELRETRQRGSNLEY